VTLVIDASAALYLLASEVDIQGARQSHVLGVVMSRDERLRRGATRLITVITPDEVVLPEHPTE
jgi:hypothetical protein